MKLFNKILIANRGEIAVRIMRSAQDLGITTVAVYSEPDKNAYHTQKADEAYLLTGNDLASTYLDIDKIIDVAVRSGSDAIHPGYGFLAENPDFVSACHKNNITFIGPDAATMLLMGNKIESRKFARENGIPITEGITGTPEELIDKAKTIKLPLLIKAAAGGGGKGMKIIHSYDELPEVLESTSREAAKYFGNPDIYIEKYVEQPRHIEVQVLADHHGHVVHLYERECSIQRRYQKIIEESPSPTLSEEVRQKICEAAVTIATKAHYKNAGTVEFLLDPNQDFYFLEMNTRVQVEHPVTEMVTGIDLVKNQVLIAAGYPLRFTQEDITQNGHAIECRIYAEEPENKFLPSPGDMALYIEPAAEHLRLDTSTHRAATVYSFFDPMISKLIGWAKNRNTAIEKVCKALGDYHIHGIKTNITYLQYILKNQDFVDNRISTDFCQNHQEAYLEHFAQSKKLLNTHLPVIAYLAFDFNFSKIKANSLSVWEQIGYWRQNMSFKIRCEETDYPVTLFSKYNNILILSVEEAKYNVSIVSIKDFRIKIQVNGTQYKFNISKSPKNHGYVGYGSHIFEIKRLDTLSYEEFSASAGGDSGKGNKVVSPMPGKVIKVNVTKGADVLKNDVLLIVEAMKMENNLVAPYDGKVDNILVAEGDMVERDVELIQLSKKENKINLNKK